MVPRWRFWQPAASCIHSTGCQTVFVKPVVQPGLTTRWTNSGSFNTVVKPVVKPVWKPVWQSVGCLFTRYSRLSNRLYNRFVSCKRGFSGFVTDGVGRIVGITAGSVSRFHWRDHWNSHREKLIRADKSSLLEQTAAHQRHQSSVSWCRVDVFSCRRCSINILIAPSCRLRGTADR